MPFRFQKSDSPAKVLQRASRQRLGAALRCLQKPKGPASIHGARKEIKKLRALFRLLRGEIRPAPYRKGVKALRAAADCLAATRDARVMLKAFETLTGPGAQSYARIGKALAKHSRREARRFRRDDAVSLALALLEKTDRRLAGIKIKVSDWPGILPGLTRSYQKGREGWRKADGQPQPETFHEWRRRVKDLGFYFRLLQPICSAATQAAVEEFELLAEQLGDDHDLFMLHEFVAEHCRKHADEVNALNRLITTREEKLRAAALKLGARLYAETPAGFSRRLGALAW